MEPFQNWAVRHTTTRAHKSTQTKMSGVAPSSKRYNPLIVWGNRVLGVPLVALAKIHLRAILGRTRKSSSALRVVGSFTEIDAV